MAPPLRGTQSLVGQMGWIWNRPALVLIEVGWRWLFGVPLLLLCWYEAQRILGFMPAWSTGLSSVNWDNPWQAVAQLAAAWTLYQPHLLTVAWWLIPAAAAGWIIVSGLGRWMLLHRMEPGLAAGSPTPLITLQAVWLASVIAIMAGWQYGLNWLAATYLHVTGEVDLIGYLIGIVILSLTTFVLWALISWVVSIAPLLVAMEGLSPRAALLRSLHLGKPFTSKLVEINLVMGIVRLALIVLATVFSAAPLPFGEQLGADSLHIVWIASTLFYLIASDYFEVVRLKSFIEFWRVYRGHQI